MPFTPSTIAASGRSWANVYLDAAHGTTIATQIADAGTTFTGASAFTAKPSRMIADKAISSRQLFVGLLNGQIAQSLDDGASWNQIKAAGATSITALCADPHYSASSFPHAYAGDSAGVLYAITDQAGYAGVTVAAIATAFPAQVNALCQPPGGHGTVWVGCADGTLWVYWPATNSRALMASFAGSITALDHMRDPGLVYGITADAAVRLFMALENPLGCTVVSLDRSQAYAGLACFGRRSLLACGTSTIVWSPDGGQTLGTAPSPGTSGPYVACALSPDPNEWAAATSTHVIRTQANGQSYLADTTVLAGIVKLVHDPLYPGVGYALATYSTYTGLWISYDNLASWTGIFNVSAVTAFCYGPLASPPVPAASVPAPVISGAFGNSFTGGAMNDTRNSSSFAGGATVNSYQSKSFTGGATS